MSVKVFKLVTGEEIIGRVVQQEGAVWTVQDPLGLGINHQEGRLVFVPFMPYTSAAEEVVLHHSAFVIEPVDPVDSIREDYTNATSRIFVPEKSIIRPAG